MPKLKNIKHESFCREIVKKKGSITKAYKVVYPDGKEINKKANASHLFAKPQIRERVNELLDRQGLSVRELNDKLGQLITADKAIVVRGKVQFVDDNSTQLDALKTAYKLHKLLGHNDNETIVDNRSVNFSLNDDNIGKVEKVLSRLEGLTKRLELKEDEQTGEVIDTQEVRSDDNE